MQLTEKEVTILQAHLQFLRSATGESLYTLKQHNDFGVYLEDIKDLVGFPYTIPKVRGVYSSLIRKGIAKKEGVLFYIDIRKVAKLLVKYKTVKLTYRYKDHKFDFIVDFKKQCIYYMKGGSCVFQETYPDLCYKTWNKSGNQVKVLDQFAEKICKEVACI